MCTEEWPNLQNIKIINIITIYKYVVEMYIKIITYTAGSAKFKSDKINFELQLNHSDSQIYFIDKGWILVILPSLEK